MTMTAKHDMFRYALMHFDTSCYDFHLHSLKFLGWMGDGPRPVSQMPKRTCSLCIGAFRSGWAQKDINSSKFN